MPYISCGDLTIVIEGNGIENVVNEVEVIPVQLNLVHVHLRVAPPVLRPKLDIAR